MAIEAQDVRTVRCLAGPMLHFPKLSNVVMRMGRILCQLITIYVIARIRRNRFTSFVSRLSVVAIIRCEEGYGCKIRRHSGRLFTSRRVSWSLQIIGCQPKMVPTIAFYRYVSPLRQER